ncbi:MAG: VOC family protein [Myxococcales bacterium]|nr:VOC family protein [Myxococcales bacterium]
MPAAPRQTPPRQRGLHLGRWSREQQARAHSCEDSCEPSCAANTTTTSLVANDPPPAPRRHGPWPMTRRLHHIAVGVNDVERVASFYCNELGLSERARHFDEHGTLRSVWLELGDALLMLERCDCPPRQVDGIGAGPFLIALCVSREERTELEARLATRGYKSDSRTQFTSYFRDPEGNRVALSAYPIAEPDSSPDD